MISRVSSRPPRDRRKQQMLPVDLREGYPARPTACDPWPYDHVPAVTVPEAMSRRRVPTLSFNRSECNPIRLFESLRLGHWSEFSWPLLLRATRPDLWERTYGGAPRQAGAGPADPGSLHASPAEG